MSRSAHARRWRRMSDVERRLYLETLALERPDLWHRVTGPVGGCGLDWQRKAYLEWRERQLKLDLAQDVT